MTRQRARSIRPRPRRSNVSPRLSRASPEYFRLHCSCLSSPVPATIQSLLHYLCATFNSSRPPETDHVHERLRIYYVQEGLPMRNPQRANVPFVHASLCYSTSTLGCSRVFEILDMKHGLRPFSIPPISQSNSALRAEQEQVFCARSWPNSTMPRLKLPLLTF